MSGRGIVASCVAGLSLSVVSVSFGALLSHEGFEAYAPGSPAAASQTLPSGGMFSSWTTSNANAQNWVIADGLTYSAALPSSGAHRLRAAGGGIQLRGALNQAVLADYVDTYAGAFNSQNVIGKPGTTVYYSFAFRVSGTTWANSQAYVRFAERTADTTYTNRMELGQTFNANGIGVAANVGLNTGFVTTTPDDQIHLFAFKVVYGASMTAADDAVTVWFDPDPALAEAAQTVDRSTTRNMTFTHFDFNSQGTASNALSKGEFDDFRIGTSFDDIVAVPEPTALGILGVGGLLALRRRKA